MRNLYEIAEDAYLARAGTVSTNGIAAVVDAIRNEIASDIDTQATQWNDYAVPRTRVRAVVALIRGEGWVR